MFEPLFIPQIQLVPKNKAKFPIGTFMFILSLFVLIFFAIFPHSNKSSAIQPTQPRVIIENLVPSLEDAAPLWQVEIGRRFDNAVGVLVHGGDFVAGHWIVGSSLQPWKHVTPIEEIIRHFQEQYPGRTLVMVCCNTGHLQLHGFPNVYIADSSVWVVPDRAVTPDMMAAGADRMTIDDDDPEPVSATNTRWQADPDVVGNIFEFHSCE